jgi:hypothetical protein
VDEGWRGVAAHRAQGEQVVELQHGQGGGVQLHGGKRLTLVGVDAGERRRVHAQLHQPPAATHGQRVQVRQREVRHLHAVAVLQHQPLERADAIQHHQRRVAHVLAPHLRRDPSTSVQVGRFHANLDECATMGKEHGLPRTWNHRIGSLAPQTGF